MKKPQSVARKLSRASAENAPRAIDINEIASNPTAAYIAQMTGELANLATGARFQSLAHLLARAQFEAEIWSRHAG
ncbi:MAG TPA: hypothetical protein VEK34_09470 [Methylocella sp.]|nr:hypothetical protein [Methylocella sp.]